MIRVFTCFAGYGTDIFALKQLGIEHELVGFSEINKYAVQCFKQNHCNQYKFKTSKGFVSFEKPINYGSITDINWSEVPDFDLLTGGFPCQSFSVAGKGLGHLDERGVLANYLTKALQIKQPRYFMFENVKGFMSKRHEEFRETLFSDWREAGYVVHHKVLNTRDFGIPQNRERVFIVGIRKDIKKFGDFVFPEPFELELKLKDLLEEDVDEKYFLKPEQVEKIFTPKVSYCIDSNYYKGINVEQYLKKKRRQLVVSHSLFPRSSKSGKGGTGHLQKEDGTSYCLDTGNCQAIEFVVPTALDLYNNKERTDYSPCLSLPHHNSLRLGIGSRVRRLTPKECFRLQGFLEDEVNLDGLSDTQKYRLAGNGQSVNVVKLLFKELLKNE